MTAPAPEVADPRAASNALPAQRPAGDRRFALRRLVTLVCLVTVFLLVINGAVGVTGLFFFDAHVFLWWEIFSAILTAAFVATSVVGFRFANGLLRMAYAISASWLGALNYIFFAAAACWLLYGVDVLLGLPISRPALATTCFGLALAVAVYGSINAARIRVTRVSVALPYLPTAWRGRSAALVTDLHLGHISGPGFLRRVNRQLRKLQPDMVLVSGDMFDGSTVGLDRLAEPWKEYSAPRGIYYVTGNHDEFAERRIYLDALRGTGIRILNNERVELEGLQLIGVHDGEASDPAALRKILRQANIDPSSPSILLAHQPANLQVAEEEGVSLQLSGHTHGGQLWPWNLLVRRIYGPFAYGLQTWGRLRVYTSSGVGTWGPPLRVGTKSEIVLIQFVQAGHA